MRLQLPSYVLSLLVLFTLSQTAVAQKSLTTVGVPVVENFDSFTGAGFDPSPAAGQLDSDEFSTSGFGESAPVGSVGRTGCWVCVSP